ncbi:glycosyltransferase family 1 protein [Butyricimonas sp.]|uniref:glycosyltransferase family 4 protein n=1 Tax=Butyricimonas sp. TaxID=1969738 RepID=UPI0025BAE136|nr:glycosyltransferase family 1 protein [Butyricimonas sp.]
MIIGIDFRFGYKSLRGMGTYVREIVKSLMELDSDNEYILYIDEAEPCEKIVLSENFRYKCVRGNYFSFEQWYLPRQAKRDGVDILWSPYNTFPIFVSKKIKRFVTIHDLIFMGKLFPKSLYQLLGKYYRRFNLLLGIKKIDKLFTVSDYSANLIQKKFKCLSLVTYNHINPRQFVFPLDQVNIVLNQFGLKSHEYFYTITGNAPSKNFMVIREIMEILSENNFVITGIKTKDWEKPPANVCITGFVTEKEKAILLQNAKGFLFLSLEEGFGIPILEAMVYDCKILASNCSVIPEIVGQGGYCITPSRDNIVEAIRHFDSPAWGSWEGRKTQLRKFSSWTNSAKVFLNAVNG